MHWLQALLKSMILWQGLLDMTLSRRFVAHYSCISCLSASTGMEELHCKWLEFLWECLTGKKAQSALNDYLHQNLNLHSEIRNALAWFMLLRMMALKNHLWMQTDDDMDIPSSAVIKDALDLVALDGNSEGFCLFYLGSVWQTDCRRRRWGCMGLE